MAERKISWSENKERCLTMGKATTGGGHSPDYTFDPRFVFPEFDTYEENQKYVILFGIKQSLADEVADTPDADGKVEGIQVAWSDLVENKEKVRKSNAKSVPQLHKELEVAKEKVVAYDAMDDAQKIEMAKIGVNRTMFVKQVESLKKRILKASL